MQNNCHKYIRNQFEIVTQTHMQLKMVTKVNNRSYCRPVPYPRYVPRLIPDIWTSFNQGKCKTNLARCNVVKIQGIKTEPESIENQLGNPQELYRKEQLMKRAPSVKINKVNNDESIENQITNPDQRLKIHELLNEMQHLKINNNEEALILGQLNNTPEPVTLNQTKREFSYTPHRLRRLRYKHCDKCSRCREKFRLINMGQRNVDKRSVLP